MTQFMHLPGQPGKTICGNTWQTYLLTPGEAYPICPACWVGEALRPDEVAPQIPAYVDVADDGERTIIVATAERLDSPKEIE